MILSDKSNLVYDKMSDISNFVLTKIASVKNYFCRDKITFVLHMARPLAKCYIHNSVLVPCIGYRLWGAVCNIHTFVDRSKFCPTEVTFVQQKSLLSDKSNFVYDKSTFVRQKLILSDKSNFVLTKIASVNKSNFVIDKITFVETKLLLCYTWRDHSPSVTFIILS